MKRKTYVETFDQGPGGWLGWKAGGGGALALEIRDGAALTQSPWGVDFNHGPPGAGYLHLLYVLLLGQWQKPQLSGPNRFVEGGYSRDFTNARFTFRLRGDIDLKDSQLLLLIQGTVGDVQPNFVLAGQPIPITRDWSEHTIVARPDPAQWLHMGTCGQNADNPRYGYAPVEQLLRDVNVDIILVLFPLNIVPLQPFRGDKHQLRAGKDYPLDQSYLPSGYVLLDEIRIDYPD